VPPKATASTPAPAKREPEAAPARAQAATAAPARPAVEPDAPASSPAPAKPAPASPAKAPAAAKAESSDAAETPATPSPSGEPIAAPVVAGPAVAAPEPTGDLAILRDHWAEIVARISLHPPTKPLIIACRPISVEDGVVTLGFPEDKSFLRAVAERRRPILEENVSAVLGRSVAVRCVATNLDLVPELPVDAEAAWVLAEARRIFLDDSGDPAEVG
jgi:hypothetical protein